METYVKETLHVLDYQDNIVDTIFTSDDHRTPGYAYNITITEANTGYSDLKFDMPNTIINDNADKIKNPKLALLTPLVKLRYRREVYYTGDKPITVREPSGYGDQVVYIDKTYSNVYPENLIEDYIMDYIVQPVDKKRDVLKLTTSFTAIDYPRFNLSKKRVGLNISQETLTHEEWSLFQNKPIDQPGKIKYTKWSSALNQTVQDPNVPLEWDAEHAEEYPLKKEHIVKLMQSASSWPYGLLASAFYWPITSTGRFEGKLYKEGGYLVLQLYDFYANSTEGIDPEHYIDRYSWDWTQLYEVQPYLCPNNADNYLKYILEGTNWSIAQRDDGHGGLEDDVDIVQSEIPNPAGSTTSTTLADDTCNINISGSNCYNAITSLCQNLQLYPVFDCINRTVALHVFAGKNYGLAYSLGQNLGNNNTKGDGEKVITKLYVSGGKDYNGDANINIGDAERTYIKTFTGFYRGKGELPTSDIEGVYAVVDPSIPAANFQVTKYNHQMEPYTVTVHDDSVKEYWIVGPSRQVYFRDNNSWVLGTDNGNGTWSYGDWLVDAQTGMLAPWDPNNDAYIVSRSPYGTNYILNLKWAYQNNWITKAQILELYQYEKAINDLDYMFMDGYTKDRLATQQEYNNAVNDYDISQDEFQSTLYSMENKYYKNGEVGTSEGSVYCFHKPPQGTYLKNNKRYIKLFHCYNCGRTQPIEPSGTNPGSDILRCPNMDCLSTNVVNNEIQIHTYDEYVTDGTIIPFDDMLYPYGTDSTRIYESPRYDPHLKGYFQRLVMSLDKANNDWDIGEYESRVSMINPIIYEEGQATIDGYPYVLNGVYVRSTSGQIEVWNDAINKYIRAYGETLDNLEKVNGALIRIQELQDLYDTWEEVRDNYHAIIQEKFGDYLIEGNYTNDQQPYVGLLFKEGLEASDKYSVPEITYNLNVIDSTGLIEYREPTITKYNCGDCDYLSYTPITECPKCGSDLILTINDTYNDLVHMLHSIGQIVPKAGDYVTVYDEPMGMYGVPATITQISRTLDNPVNNKIQLDTSYTDDEELVGNIITATNTVLSNKDIYARTAVLKSDGTMDADSIKKTLDNSGADITIVGTNGNILLNGSGLRCTDPADPTRAMKYAGNGIFKTTNLGPDGSEATVWETMMTPNGINATYINSGTIDTNKLTIMSGLSSKVVLDQYGLQVKNAASKVSHITEFDQNAAKNNAAYARNWGATNNLNAFIGVDGSNNGLIYTKGFLYAEEGSNIANWITSNDGFYHLYGTTKDLWLSPGGIAGTVNNINGDYAFYANGNFGVTTGGKLVATGADFSGKIIVTDGDSQVNVGELGGWKSSPNGFKNNLNQPTLILSATGGAISSSVYNSGYRNDWGIYMNGKFGVTTNGDVYMTSAHVKGDIYAESGVFNGTVYASDGSFNGTITTNNITATGGNISNLNATNLNISGNSTFSGSLNGATGTFSGDLNAAGGTFKGRLSAATGSFSGSVTASSGTIGGWTINGTEGIKSGNNDIRTNGSFYMYPQVGSGGEYKFDNGMTLHSTAQQLIESGSNINLRASQAIRVEAASNIYLDSSNIYVGPSDKKAKSGQFTYDPGWGTGTKKLNFVNGILVEDGTDNP